MKNTVKEPGEEEAQALYAIFEEKLLSILPDHSGVKPGVVETVNRLRRNGILIGSTTGYNDKMMEIVAPAAKAQGYEPDAWFSPDSTGPEGAAVPVHDLPQHGSSWISRKCAGS